MILSGTASGVIGAAYVAEICGLPRCMSLDIGGTSADVAIITEARRVAHVAGDALLEVDRRGQAVPLDRSDG